MKRSKNKRIKSKHVIIALSVLSVALGALEVRNLRKQTSLGLIAEAKKACDNLGPAAMFCMVGYIAEKCSPGPNGEFLDLKVCGIIEKM